jgi:hypothetical protein
MKKILKMPRFYHDMVVNGSASKLSLNPNHSYSRKLLFLNYRFDCNKVLNSFNELLIELKSHLLEKNKRYDTKTIEVASSLMQKYRKKYHKKISQINLDAIIPSIKCNQLVQTNEDVSYYLVPIKIVKENTSYHNGKTYKELLAYLLCHTQEELDRLDLEMSTYIKKECINLKNKKTKDRILINFFYNVTAKLSTDLNKYMMSLNDYANIRLIDWHTKEKLSSTQRSYIHSFINTSLQLHKEVTNRTNHIDSCLNVANEISKHVPKYKIEEETLCIVNCILNNKSS